MTLTENLFENLRLELRRGCLTLADDGLAIDESTLYPLLRRLEAQGLLASEWREEEKRNKRFYRITPDGAQLFAQLLAEWQAINASVTETLRARTGDAQ